jgi:ceramide glucosyltransferase
MRTSFDALDLALATLAVSSLGSTFVLHWAVSKKRQIKAAVHGYRPAISVLKPLCGVDEGLYENLVSFVEQRYPEYELILGVADPRDRVLTLVQRLRQAYPDAPLRVVVHGEDDPLANPKVISLTHMARAARYDHLLVSDSNVRARPDYLSAIAAEMADPTVGLVSSLIVGAGESSLGAQCENLHLNTFVLGGVCVADLADRPCVVGKSMLMRRAELAALGGFDSLRNVLAEDYLLGQRYHDAGFRVVLSGYAVDTFNCRLSLRRFLARHLRWAQLRRSCAFAPFCSEPLLYASPFLLLPLLAHDPAHWYLFSSLGLCARLGGDGLLARTTSGRWPSPSALALLPLKDALMLCLWVIALLRRSVAWRGHALRIGPGSRLLPRGRSLLRVPGLRQRAAHAPN